MASHFDEEEKYDTVYERYVNDKRDIIPLETYDDGSFTLMTEMAAEQTVSVSVLYAHPGPRLASRSEALYVLGRKNCVIDAREFIDSYIRPTEYRNPEMKFPQVPVHPKFISLIKELNAQSGAKHVTLSSTLNNILDIFFYHNSDAVACIQAGIVGKGSRQ